MKNNRDKIIEVYKEVTKNNEHPNSYNLENIEEEELEWDSFDKMVFVDEIESVFKIKLDEYLFEIIEAETLKEIIELIENIIKNWK